MLNNIQLSPHFSLLELTESATARQRDIANIPPPEAVENLKRLCKGTLEPLRKALGLPVIITSGYRCKELNNIVNRSSKTSQHMQGCAADFYVSSAGSMRQSRGSLTKVRATQGSMTRFSDLKVQSVALQSHARQCKTKKVVFCFALFSLIRTFDPWSS